MFLRWKFIDGRRIKGVTRKQLKLTGVLESNKEEEKPT